MPVARNAGESIAGDSLTYAFGKVTSATKGLREHPSLGLDGTAYVSRAWRRVEPGATPRPMPPGFDSLEAWSADGECDKHKPDTQKAHRGAHRKFTGVLKGDAKIVVVVSRGAKR